MNHAIIKIQVKGQSLDPAEFIVIDFIEDDIIIINTVGAIKKKSIADFNRMFVVTKITLYEVESKQSIDIQDIFNK